MNVFLFLANGFEEIEAVATIDVLRRGGVTLTTISIHDTLQVTGAHEMVLQADELFTDVDFSKAEMLILPGGMPGTTNLGNHSGLTKLLLNQNKKGGLIAAICAAPSILGKLHLLRNQTAVCYPGFEDQLLEAYIGKEDVVISGNIITAKGPGLAIAFGLTLLAKLKSQAVADQVAEGLLYKK